MPTVTDPPTMEAVDAEQGVSATSWVQCDRCNQWRRIPKALADSLNEDINWYCENNPNRLFASCNKGQELTNEEIDQQLSSSDEDDNTLEKERQRRKRRPAVWQLVRENIYTHRQRKKLDEDDIMICQCRPVYAGGDGCGPDCLNRILNIECVPGFCPAEDKCTNQMLSRRQYKQLEQRRAGPKGFGLFTRESIRAGEFIIEYIGEVLEEEEYMRRKEYYFKVGQRHYYFMNIGNGEVIDACRKGALGRFINHSCDPNCETQKWLVNGELAIGLFASKDIRAGEELTFDYNFERYGDKPYKCWCKSKDCRGYIGGTPETIAESELAAPEDATQDPEPIMVVAEKPDPALAAILDKNVGLGIEEGWDARLQRRLEQLAAAQGVPLDQASASSRDGAAGQLDSDSEADSSGKEDEHRRHGIVDGSKARLQGKHSGGLKRLHRKTDIPTDRAELSPAARAALAAAVPMAARKHLKALHRLAAGASPVPSSASADRKSFIDRVKAEPSVSNASSSPTAAAAVSSAATPRRPLAEKAVVVRERLATVDSDRFPSRSRRRSEIDRRLDIFLGPSGRLREPNTTTIVKILRLFNLCDIGPLPSQPATSGERRPRSPRSRRSPSRQPSKPTQPPAATASPTRTSPQPSAATAAATTERQASPTTSLPPVATAAGRNGVPTSPVAANGVHDVVEDGEVALEPEQEDGELPGVAAGGAADGAVSRPAAEAEAADGAPVGAAAAAAAGEDWDGAGPAEAEEKEAGRRRRRRRERHRHRHRSRDRESGGGGRHSPSRRREGRSEAGRREEEVESGVRAETGRAAHEMTARQRARMADLSLLLDVILKTNSLSAKKEFVRCGILRQLQTSMGRNVSPQHTVILRKVLRVVEVLPLTADDLHITSSAHGSFADILKDLSHHPDLEVTIKAVALLKKYPVGACSRAMPAGARSSGGSAQPSPQSRPGPSPSPASLSRARSNGFSTNARPSRFHPDGNWGRFGSMGKMAGGYHPSPTMPGASKPTGFHEAPYPHLDNAPYPHPPAQDPPPYQPGLNMSGTFSSPFGAQVEGDRPTPPAAPPLASEAELAEIQRSMHQQPQAGTFSPLRSPAHLRRVVSWSTAAGAPGAALASPARKRTFSQALGDPALPPGFGGTPSLAHTTPPPPPPPLSSAANGLSLRTTSAAEDSTWDVETEFVEGMYGGGLAERTPAEAAPQPSAQAPPLPQGAPSGALQDQTYSPLLQTFSPLRPDAGTQPPPWALPPQQQQQQATAGVEVVMSDGKDVGPWPAALRNGMAGGKAQDVPMASSSPEGSEELFNFDATALDAGTNGVEGVYDDSWERPNDQFCAFVAEVVRHRIQKYLQPDHPNCISSQDASNLYRKLKREIVEKENEAFAERQRMEMPKPIERRKLEGNIKEFVRQSIRRLHMHKAGV